MADRGYIPYNPHGPTMVVLEHVRAILREYADDLPLTLRQVFYRLVALGVLDKTEKAYSNLGGYLRRARRASMLKERGSTPYIPFSAIRDDSTSAWTPLTYDGRGEFERSLLDRAQNFKLDRQTGQRQVIEIWCEAAGLIPTLRELAGAFSISVYSSGGVDGVTPKHDLAVRALRRSEQGTMTRVLHVGDFDPTGEMMHRVLREDVGTMVWQLTGSEDFFVVERVALTPEQIVDMDVITAPAKPLDNNLRRFIRENRWLCRELGTDQIAAQLEALTPVELRAMLTDVITSHIEGSAYEDTLAREQQIRTRLVGQLEPTNPFTRKAWGLSNGDS
jgi:hypothetical protein